MANKRIGNATPIGACSLHETGGPVPNYVTLSGNGREVEIGAFLSEDERVELFSELQARFNDYRNRLT